MLVIALLAMVLMVQIVQLTRRCKRNGIRVSTAASLSIIVASGKQVSFYHTYRISILFYLRIYAAGVWYPNTSAAKAELSSPNGVYSTHLSITTNSVHNGCFIPLYSFIPDLLEIKTRVVNQHCNTDGALAGNNNFLVPLVTYKLLSLGEYQVSILIFYKYFTYARN